MVLCVPIDHVGVQLQVYNFVIGCSFKGPFNP